MTSYERCHGCGRVLLWVAGALRCCTTTCPKPPPPQPTLPTETTR